MNRNLFAPSTGLKSNHLYEEMTKVYELEPFISVNTLNQENHQLKIS
jgi:hypothetical protein